MAGQRDPKKDDQTVHKMVAMMVNLLAVLKAAMMVDLMVDSMADSRVDSTAARTAILMAAWWDSTQVGWRAEAMAVPKAATMADALVLRRVGRLDMATAD